MSTRGVCPTVVQASSVSSHGRNAFTRAAPCLCLVRCPFTRLQQPRITTHRTFGAETAHGPPLVASGFPGHLAQTASIPEPRRTQRVALLVPPYLRRRKSSIRAFGTEGQHHPVGLFLHNKTHITRAASAFSLNHHCKTSSIDLKPCVGRNRQPSRTWQNAFVDHFPQQRSTPVTKTSFSRSGTHMRERKQYFT
jgi:hypothetical protein